MRIAVAGASGFVGRRLVAALHASGHDVVALGRNASSLPSIDGVARVALDVSDASRLGEAVEGCEAAYYLVHSMAGDAPFADRDNTLARSFAQGCASAGVRRIVYLGALGSDDLSEHLASRQDVGRALASAGADVVELRAAVVIGAGSISFEMMRYLVERLPVMVCPRWLRTRIEPIGAADVIRYLEGALDVASGTYEIGSSATTYRELMQLYARVRGLRRRRILDVPLLSLRLSAYWVDFVTPVDRRVSHALIGSLASEVVVRDRDRTRAAFGFDPVPLEDALRAALDEQRDAISAGIFERECGLRDNVYVDRATATTDARTAEGVRVDLAGVGGDLGWYGITPAWRVRQAFGRLVGEESGLVRPEAIAIGARADWWTIERADGSSIVLRAFRWWPGDGWLGFRVAGRDEPRVEIVGAFRPRGLPGFAYWKALGPVHRWTFQAMLRHRLARGRRSDQ